MAQNLPRDVLQEIARRVGMRNRTALEATSRTMRAAARPVTAEITQKTRAGLCRALEIAFGIHRVMRSFTRVQLRDRSAVEKAVGTYVAAAKARARPGEGAEMSFRMAADAYDTTCNATSLFVGYVNGTRIHVDAIIRMGFMQLSARATRAGPLTRSGYVTVTDQGITVGRHASVAWLKKALRRTGRRVAPDRAHLAVRLQFAQGSEARPMTIALKVASRAIKACATSLRATMW